MVLHGCEDGNDHVMPVALKGEPEHDQTDAAEDGGGVDNDQACLGVQSALMSIHIKGAHCIVEVMPRQPANDDTDDAEEVEVTCHGSVSREFARQGMYHIPMPRVEKP